MIGKTRRRDGIEIGWRSVALLLLFCLAATGAATAAISILPLGDSITYGGPGDGGVSIPSYRAWLYQDLRASGYDVDFVGSLNKPDAPAGSDPDNEGHPGYTSGKVLAELPTWLNAYPPPQVALVHLGTNDVLDGVPTARTIADLTSIVGVLRARNPSMTILVAQIIPTSVGSTNTAIEGLNQEIAGLAALSTVQSPVVIVDQYTGYDGEADNQEGGVHPVTTGEKKIAAAWERALIPVLSQGVPIVVTTVPITPTPTVVPTTQPTVIATEPTTSPTAVPTILPATATPTVPSHFGARVYRIGGTAAQTRSGSSGSILTGTGRSRTTISSAATSLTPPTTSFTRWYPAARWSAGLQ